MDNLIEEDKFNENSKLNKSNNTIYLIHYQNGSKVQLSFWTLKSISCDNYLIKHSSMTEKGSSGALIFNISNQKVKI